MPRQLTVWLFGRHVGTLAQVEGRLGFSYAPEWLAQTDAVSLSQSLPGPCNTRSILRDGQHARAPRTNSRCTH